MSSRWNFDQPQISDSKFRLEIEISIWNPNFDPKSNWNLGFRNRNFVRKSKFGFRIEISGLCTQISIRNRIEIWGSEIEIWGSEIEISVWIEIWDVVLYNFAEKIKTSKFGFLIEIWVSDWNLSFQIEIWVLDRNLGIGLKFQPDTWIGYVSEKILWPWRPWRLEIGL